jgi:hypothetical protein
MANEPESPRNGPCFSKPEFLQGLSESCMWLLVTARVQRVSCKHHMSAGRDSHFAWSTHTH